MEISQGEMPLLLAKKYLFVPKSSHQNILLQLAIKTIKPDIQLDSEDYQFLGPAACPPMRLFLSLLYK
jgi:hypothetical protein